MVRDIWMYSLIPEAMAMGFSNILLPVFIVIELKGNLLEVGLFAGVSSFCLIPSVILWGNLADRLYKCKVFMLLSFAGMGFTFLLISAANNVYELLAFTALRSIFYAASIPARQILTVESEGRKGWEGGISHLQFVAGLGEAMGIALGVTTVSTVGFRTLLALCGLLSFISVIASAVLIHDPGLIIERRLMGVERFINTLVKASNAIGCADTYFHTGSLNRLTEIFRPSIKLFMLGIFGFSLAGNMFFTPLPIYFLNFYTTSMVFLLFYVDSMANAFSYIFVGRIVGSGRKPLILTSALRMILIPLLILPAAMNVFSGFMLAAVILALLGVIWAIFDVISTCLYMELSRLGRVGLYSALVGLGSAVGGFLGGYVSMLYGFEALFTICGLIYAATLITFALQFKRWSSAE